MNESRTPTPGPPAPGAWRTPVLLDDLLADLTWPRLLRAGALTFRPSRLGLAFFYLVGLFVLVTFAGALDRVEGNALAAAAQQWVVHLTALVQSCARLDGETAGQAINGMFISTVWELVRDHTVVAIIFLPIILVWTTLIGGAICRLAAMDFAQGVGLSWPEGLGYASGRWSSFAGSVAGPLALLYAIALAMAVGGWLLFSLPGVNVLGGLFWFMFLLAAAVGALIMIAMTLGGPMLVPAVACEGTDAIDAVQHAYSYVFARPLRLLIYMAILVLEFLVLFCLVVAVLWLLIHFAQHAAGIWVGERADAVLRGSALAPGDEGQAARADVWAAWLVDFWTGVVRLLGGAFVVSFFWCAATVLYLCMRRISDGQDISEVWVDTVVPGTMAERRTVGGAPAAGAVPAPEAVADNGPADEG